MLDSSTSSKLMRENAKKVHMMSLVYARAQFEPDTAQRQCRRPSHTTDCPPQPTRINTTHHHNKMHPSSIPVLISIQKNAHYISSASRICCSPCVIISCACSTTSPGSLGLATLLFFGGL